ncbi:MAG: hypothetical protein Kow00106_14150 [Anaerolineae bacterium]
MLGIATLGVTATFAFAPLTHAPSPLLPQGLPGRVSPTPPLTMTGTPSPSVTPEWDCTRVFPLENVEAVEPGQTTLLQLQAAFGRARRETGRANYFRFSAQGCDLRALIGVDEVLEIELRDYGTLDLLLERYGIPAAVGVSQGNLTLLEVGYAVLLYPERGAIAVLPVEPEALTPTTPIDRLIFRPPFAAQKQLTRLNARPVAWPLATATPGRES